MSKEEYIDAIEARVIVGEKKVTTTDLLIELGFVDLKVNKYITSAVRTALSRKGIEQKTIHGYKYYCVDVLKLNEVIAGIKLVTNSEPAKIV